MKNRVFLSLVFLNISGIDSLPAATVTWSTSQGLADTEISTVGTQVFGYYFNSNAGRPAVAVVNTVPFQRHSTGEAPPGLDFATSYNLPEDADLYQVPLSAANAGLNAIMDGQNWGFVTPMPLALTGLEPGQAYLFQYMVSDDRGTYVSRNFDVSDTGDPEGMRDIEHAYHSTFGSGVPSGAPPGSIEAKIFTGIFTADANGKQEIWNWLFEGPNHGDPPLFRQVNAIQVRRLIPEPASFDRFRLTGSLTTARRAHAATLLQNGKVLVTGGVGNDGVSEVAAAEVFDVTTGRWGTAGGLATARHAHTAVILPNGMVLVAGGLAGGARLASAELYAPTTGSWSTTGPLITARSRHTATLLTSGLILLCGGEDGAAITAAELYDPISGLCAGTGPLTTGRHSHTATLLPDGRVLVAGGTGSAGSLPTAEVYEPATGTWSATGPLATARSQHSAVLLPGGKVLVVGGSALAGVSLSSAEVYDPATNGWTATSPLVNARQHHSAVLLPNGKVHVEGGKDGSGPVGVAEAYDPVTGTWDAAGRLVSARASHTATLLPSGTVLCSGGEAVGQPATAAAEVYEYAFGNVRPTGAATPNIGFRRPTLLADGSVLITGGEVFPPAALAAADIFDSSTETSSPTAPMNTPRVRHTATLLPNGKVLVAGGAVDFSGGPPAMTPSVELFDPVTRTWTIAASLSSPRIEHAATVLPSGKVLVAGGYRSSSSDLVGSTELYDPATNTWSLTGSLVFPCMVRDTVLLPNGKVLLTGSPDSSVFRCQIYDPDKGTWAATSSPSTVAYDCSTSLLPNGKVLSAGGWNSGSSELYDPATETWTPTGALGFVRRNDTAILLHTGKMMAGLLELSDGLDGRAELYDPSTGTWRADAGTLFRNSGAKILLLNHKVLLLGGFKPGMPEPYPDLYDPGLDYSPARTPQILSAAFDAMGRLSLNGTGFRGHSNTAGGSTLGSSDFPLVQLQRIDSQQTLFLPSDAGTSWSDTGFTSAPIAGFPRGHALLTVVTNGIPSTSVMVFVPAAEIEVALAGAPISEGETAAFGPVGLGQESLRTFTVKNTGDAMLTGIGVSLDGPEAAAFSIVSQPDSSLNPLHGTTEFTIRFAPTTLGAKTATLHIASSDSSESRYDVVLTGSGLNSAPSVTGPAHQTIDEDSSTGPLAFLIGDAETPADALTVTCTSSNQALMPDGDIVLGGAGMQRTVTLTPTPNGSGTTTLTLTVSDGEVQATSSFPLTVVAVNDPPTLGPISLPPAILEDSAGTTIALGGIGAGPLETQQLIVTAISDNPGVIPHPTINYTSPSANGLLTYTPVAGASGRATITVTVTDGQSADATTTRTFLVTVTPALRATSMGLAEVNTGTATMRFRLEIGSPAAEAISVHYATVAGSATAGSDFTSATGTATIPAGATETFIEVGILGDDEFEAHEAFSVVLSDPVNATLRTPSVTGTVTNDDAPPSLSLSHPSVTESAQATTFHAWISVSIPGPLPFPVDWLVATRSGTAQAGSDFNAIAPALLTFAPGQTSKWVAVAVTGSIGAAEAVEEFYVDFTAVSGPAPVQTATCTIQRLAITQFFPLAGGVYALRFPTGIGQSYVIQESASLAGPYANNSAILAGSGSTITQVVFSDAPAAFFRVTVTSSAPGAPAVGP